MSDVDFGYAFSLMVQHDLWPEIVGSEAFVDISGCDYVSVFIPEFPSKQHAIRALVLIAYEAKLNSEAK